jgi:hypothetical protein
MVEWTTITEPEKPECYDRLRELTPEAWSGLTQLQLVASEPLIIEAAKDQLETMGLMKDGRITQEGRLAYSCHMEFVGEQWDYENDGKTWMSCAVIATDGNGHDVLLHAFGPAFDWHIEQYGHTCEAICLDGYTEPGVWVFVGSCGSVPYHTYDGLEYDLESTGDFRAPTEEEWDLIKEDECPWDRENLPKWPKARDIVIGDDLKEVHVKTSGGSSGSGPTA